MRNECQIEEHGSQLTRNRLPIPVLFSPRRVTIIRILDHHLNILEET